MPLLPWLSFFLEYVTALAIAKRLLLRGGGEGQNLRQLYPASPVSILYFVSWY